MRRSKTRRIFHVSITLLLVSTIFCQNGTKPHNNSTSDQMSSSWSNRSQTMYSNASSLLSDLLLDYDIRLRPGFGGDALLLTMDIIIASFDSISEVDMDYTLTMYLHQYWTDERLRWSNEIPIDEMTLSGEFSQNIWVPDTFLANDKHSYLHEVTERNKMLRINVDGKVAYGMRLTSTLSCSMNLRNFPLDSQNCTVEIESYGYTTSEVLMKWNYPLAVHGVEQADVPQFTITGFHTEDSIVSTATGSYQRLSLVFQLRRSVGYFIFQTYLPCVLIVMLSWVSFWINHEATSARVALGITTVLTMTTISTGVRQSLPRISYVKSIDIYLVMCFVFVFAALLEYAAVNYSYWGRERGKGGGGNEWPVNGANKEDRESAVNVQKWVPSGLMDGVPQPQDRRVEALEEAMSTSNTAAQNNNFESTSKPKKRSSSPIPPLCRAGNTISEESESPDYPRYSTTSLKGARPHASLNHKTHHLKGRSSARAKRRMTLARMNVSMKQSISGIGRRARKVIPTIRVRDVNLIDKYSRVVFPVCFIVFNLFYWSYYMMVPS
ncbi:Gamma-aminobutyric acid receptor subunit beta [Caenorhabditis elegans]|uniref:Gamma-aminobutyric acid receptor subunit beta n=1 Tax=Caenorhabditis elegans TaxID=6239 RepID=GBRB_CAEEL|nr:Gamma-aminobutyric acid receptor subunit beta [Caenorhabditis elegans]O18276.3 RecName: Full=Gamma-aminobutyric acid receptor subunit beta; AltName: Full=GABA(A) receptor subunit beta; Flags: Precursor [Caenorhabditis elegans]CAB07719.3 Gamma-aminobutyric acid receptor subunit beta [Caenorhabditis elegans]|eukprot:NP_499661.2 Gamma-aminobutyric acid receptor subunit beta [Caenorhabditis elegans]